MLSRPVDSALRTFQATLLLTRCRRRPAHRLSRRQGDQAHATGGKQDVPGEDYKNNPSRLGAAAGESSTGRRPERRSRVCAAAATRRPSSAAAVCAHRIPDAPPLRTRARPPLAPATSSQETLAPGASRLDKAAFEEFFLRLVKSAVAISGRAFAQKYGAGIVAATAAIMILKRTLRAVPLIGLFAAPLLGEPTKGRGERCMWAELIVLEVLRCLRLPPRPTADNCSWGLAPLAFHTVGSSHRSQVHLPLSPRPCCFLDPQHRAFHSFLPPTNQRTALLINTSWSSTSPGADASRRPRHRHRGGVRPGTGGLGGAEAEALPAAPGGPRWSSSRRGIVTAARGPACRREAI